MITLAGDADDWIARALARGLLTEDDALAFLDGRDDELAEKLDNWRHDHG